MQADKWVTVPNVKHARQGGQADELANSIVHGLPYGGQAAGNLELWKNNPEAWDAVRIKVDEMLHTAARD